jgi:manganese/zinc/iron transport system substrate-binding protein
MNMKKKNLMFMLLILLFLTACTNEDPSNSVSETEEDKIQVVTTTTMITDLVKQIGGEHVSVEGMMGPGIDPHGYRATPSDAVNLQEADIIVYNGLDLEGQLSEVLEALENEDRDVIVLEDAYERSQLLASEDGDGAYDPHIWFDVGLWKEAAAHVASELADYDPQHAEIYRENNEQYQKSLDTLEDYILEHVSEIPAEKRYLVTAHDAFSYFGEAYDFEVVGIQGLNSQTEAGTRDISRLADLIAEREIGAIFIETSVSTRNIEALQDAVQARGFDVDIGGELYSDSLGSESENAETYIKMFRNNIETIVNGLKN